MNKSALIERLVRLGATDVPGTPRLLMKQRSPQELAALQQGVTDTFRRFEDPAKKAIHGVLDKVPHEKARNVLKSGANTLIENPEMLPITALPIPGASVAYLAGKRGLEKGLDRLSPLPKLAFSTNAFSGPMNPTIATGASYQPGFKIPGLQAPVQQKTAMTLVELGVLGGGLSALGGGIAGYKKGKEDDRAVSGALRGALGAGLGFFPGALGGAIGAHNLGMTEDGLGALSGGALGAVGGYKALTAGMGKKEKTAEEFKLQGHTTHQGLGIAIENRKGSVRKGVDKDGKPWRTKMIHPYGYIKGTKGADGEEVDCYVGPCSDASHAHVVHQKKEDGSYDEDKVMLGFASKDDARKAYLAHYNTDRFLGPIKSVFMPKFKEMVESGKKLVKISASSPTRGGFMLASDIPAFKSPSLRAPIEKNSDMLPDYVPSDEGAGFKRSKYASALEKLKTGGKIRVFNGDPLLDRKKEDPIDRGEIVAEDGVPVTKEADISPTQPLGDGGGNPHRMQSWLASPRVNSLAAPLNKVAEPMGDFVAAYWGGPGAAGRGPVNEAGFRQASDQNGPPTNSLRAPLRKLGSLVPGSAAAAKNVGTKPMFSGGPGQSIADIAKPKGMKFGGPLPGANKTTIGGYVPPSLK